MKDSTRDKFLSFCLNRHFDITSPESRQREAVFSDDKFVIPAGAGSGKTTVLTYRFLRLIMDEDIAPIHSDEILTITFTKAATANMKSRIYRTLRSAEKEGLISHEEVDRFSKAEISTTDSFCSKIVRMDSIRYGIAPDFAIEDEDDHRAWTKESVGKLIYRSLDDEEIRKLVAHHGRENITSALESAGKNYFDFSSQKESEEAFVSSLLQRFEEKIERNIKESEEKLSRMVTSFSADFSPYAKASDDIAYASSFFNGWKENCFLPEKFTFSRTRSLEKGNESLNDSFTKRRKEIKEELETLKEVVSFRNGDSSLLSAWGKLLYRHYTNLALRKRSRGLLTFHDVLLLSIDILRTNSEIRHYFNRKYKRIMVDEFQDNNGDNKRLLYLLAAKEDYSGPDYPETDDIEMEKIFMVGDEKQSIYRFRGADVSVFKNIASDFGSERVLTLSENFRSEKTVIDRINTMFSSSIMPLDPKADYEAQYKSLVSNVHKTSLSQMQLLWMDWEVWKKHKDRKYLTDQHLSEAMAVASFIKNEILANPEAWPVSDKKGGERAPRPGDIAILLRKGSNQSDFERALRHYRIPFNVPANKSLTMDAVLNDFYNVLQCVVYGKDDLLSFASFLRSPFASISESGIKLILDNLREERDMEEGLDQDDRALLTEALETLEGARERAGRGKITPVLTYLWIDRGYRYFIEAQSENRAYGEHYDYLFSLSSSFDGDKRSLVEFLDRIRPLLGKESDLKDITVQSEEKSGVTIETIHKSKGLEYPIVFVSDTGGRKNRGSSISVTPDSALVPTIPFCRLVEDKVVNPWAVLSKKEENDLENAENKRILYVAATRAEHHLIFSGSISGEAKNDEKNGKYRNLLHYILKGLRFQKDEEENGNVSYSCAFPDSIPDDESLPFAPFRHMEFEPVYMSTFHKGEREEESELDEKWYEEPRELKRGKIAKKCGVTTLIEEEDLSSSILPSSLFIKSKEGRRGKVLPRISIDDYLVETEEDKITGDSEEEKEEERKAQRERKITLFGTLVHKTLQDKILDIDDDYSSFFSDEPRQKEIIGEALRLRDGFFSSSFFRNTLSGFTLTPERNFMVMDGDRVVEGIIDLYCENEDEILILDYKTDSMRIDEDHTNQLNYYRKAVESMGKGKKISAAVFYLRDPENVLFIK